MTSNSSGTVPLDPSLPFAEQLAWHLSAGTRPTRQARQWSFAEFARAVGITERALRQWRAGQKRPNDLRPIERALFGDAPGAPVHEAWREALREAHARASRRARPRAPITTAPQRAYGGRPERPPWYFMGREREVAVVAEAIAAGQSVLVQGEPGIGKSTLTLKVAWHEDVVEAYGGARWFIPLETAASTRELVDAIAHAVGCDAERALDGLLEHLNETGGLLILDNLDSVWERVEARTGIEHVLTRLAALPHLAILASFRGEHFVDGPRWLVRRLMPLDTAASASLFTTLVEKDGARPAVDDPRVLRLVAALGGVPLAINLVARHAFGTRSLDALWQEWEAVGIDIARDRYALDGRQTSLRTSIELSLRSPRMTAEAERLFALLGDLPAGLHRNDMGSLVEDGVDAWDRLLRVGLAMERAGRLDLLPPIRDFARRYRPTTRADRDNLARYYLALTSALNETLGTKTGLEAVGRIAPEFANLEAAFGHTLEMGERAEAVGALPAAARIAALAGLPGQRIAERVAAACREAGDPVGEAEAVFRLAVLALDRYALEDAGEAYRHAMSLYQATGQRKGEAFCRLGLAELALEGARPDPDAAVAGFRAARRILREERDSVGEAQVLSAYAQMSIRETRYRCARVAIEAARGRYAKAHHLHGETGCLLTLGDIALWDAQRQSNDLAAAFTAYRKAWRLARQIGALVDEATALCGLGDVAHLHGRLPAASRAYRAASVLYEKAGNVRGNANASLRLGEIALGRMHGDAARDPVSRTEALRFFIAAAADFRAIGDHEFEAKAKDGVRRVKAMRALL